MSLPKRLLRALDKRDGHRCAWHWEGGCDTATLVPHHRANRGMGGRPSLDRLSNLVWLDSRTNGLIECDPVWAEAARKRGIKISGHSEPAEVAIVHAAHGRVLLGDDGEVRRAT